MKILVKRSSSFSYEVVKEFDSLDDCITELLKEDFKGCTPSIIVSKVPDWYSEEYKACDYVAEIYDSWRE